MIFAVMAALLVSMVLVLLRAFIGPDRYNRILAINLFGTKTVLFVAVAGFLFGRPEFLDIAILYALVNFVATIAVLRLTHHRELLSPSGDLSGDPSGGLSGEGGGR